MTTSPSYVSSCVLFNLTFSFSYFFSFFKCLFVSFCFIFLRAKMWAYSLEIMLFLSCMCHSSIMKITPNCTLFTRTNDFLVPLVNDSTAIIYFYWFQYFGLQCCNCEGNVICIIIFLNVSPFQNYNYLRYSKWLRDIK